MRKRFKVWVLVLILLSANVEAFMAQARASQAAGSRYLHPQRARLQSALARLPLLFEKNQGQFGRGVGFLARGQNYSLALDSGGPWTQAPPRSGCPTWLRRASRARHR